MVLGGLGGLGGMGCFVGHLWAVGGGEFSGGVGRSPLRFCAFGNYVDMCLDVPSMCINIYVYIYIYTTPLL